MIGTSSKDWRVLSEHRQGMYRVNRYEEDAGAKRRGWWMVDGG